MADATGGRPGLHAFLFLFPVTFQTFGIHNLFAFQFIPGFHFINHSGLLCKQIMAEVTVCQHILVLKMGERHISCIASVQHNVFRTFVLFGNGEYCKAQYTDDGRDNFSVFHLHSFLLLGEIFFSSGQVSAGLGPVIESAEIR
jgi:hypothetical protein